MAECSEIEAGGEVRTVKDTTARQGVATNAAAIEAINEKIIDRYSTSPVKTNKIWIDDKPIYRLVIHSTSFPISLPANIDNIVSLSAMIDTKNDLFSRRWTTAAATPYVRNSDEYNAYVLNVNSSKTEVSLTTMGGGGNMELYDCYITLEYTRVTD